MKKKHSVIIIRNRGKKLVEFRIVTAGKYEKTKFKSDNIVTGSMDIKTIPEKFNPLIEWLEKNNKLKEIENLIYEIFK